MNSIDLNPLKLYISSRQSKLKSNNCVTCMRKNFQQFTCCNCKAVVRSHCGKITKKNNVIEYEIECFLCLKEHK